MWLGLRNANRAVGGGKGRWGGCVRAGFLKKGFPSGQKDQLGGKVGEGGKVLKAEERSPSRGETEVVLEEWGMGVLVAGKGIGGNEEDTGPERGQMGRRGLPEPGLSL